MKNGKFYLLLLIVFICSCNKTKTTVDTIQPGVVKSFFSFQAPQVDGYFFFESVGNHDTTIKSMENNDTAIKNTVTMEGFLYDKKGKQIAGGGMVSIGGYRFFEKSLQYAASGLSTDSVFGVNLTFSLITPPNTAASPVIANFYSPTAIYITNNTSTPAQLNLPPDSSLKITWNMDPKNNNGVNIAAVFSASDYSNSTLTGASPISSYIDTSMMVNDNGSMILPPGFFSKFPKGGIVRLLVERGNAMIAESGSYRYYIGGFKYALEFVNIAK